MTTNPTRAGRREWTALAVLMLPLLLVSMDVSVLYFAIPAISADLEPSAVHSRRPARAGGEVVSVGFVVMTVNVRTS